MKDNTLDASDVTTRHSNSKLNLTSLLKNPSKYKKKKFEMMIYRLIKNEKRQYPFSTIRETCVYINSLDSQNEPYFSLYPAELVNKNGFQLHISITKLSTRRSSCGLQYSDPSDGLGTTSLSYWNG